MYVLTPASSQARAIRLKNCSGFQFLIFFMSLDLNVNLGSWWEHNPARASPFIFSHIASGFLSLGVGLLPSNLP